jgi:hypothetical protein
MLKNYTPFGVMFGCFLLFFLSVLEMIHTNVLYFDIIILKLLKRY